MITKLIREWASTGSKTEPTNTKKDGGWVVRERPPAEWFNWLQNEKDKRINQLINALQTALGGMPDTADETTTGRPNQFDNYGPWHLPSSVQNSYDTSTQIIDTAVGWDSENEYPVMFIYSEPGSSQTSQSTLPLEGMPCWQYGDDLSNVVLDRTITPGFNVDYAVNQPMPMVCADGFLFIVVEREAADTGGLWLQKYAIDNWTGTPVASTQWITEANKAGDYSILCEADTSTLAMVQLDGSSQQIVHFAAKDTTAGTASAAVGTREELQRPLSSDGLNLYFATRTAVGGTRQIYRMPISTKVGTSVTYTGTREVTGIVALGDGYIVCMTSPTGAVSPSIVTAYDNAGTFTLLEDTINLTDNDTDVEGWPGAIGFDGVNVYLAWEYNGRCRYHKISADCFAYALSSQGCITAAGVTDEFQVPAYSDTTAGYVASYLFNKNTMYDGRDLWVIHHNDDTVFRITSPSQRGFN